MEIYRTPDEKKLICMKVDILRNDHGDATNGGVSSRYKDVLVPMEGGNVTVDLEQGTPPENLMRVVVRRINRREYTHLEPWDTGGKWNMMGGNFAYSCDSRFRNTFDGPVPIHDRFES